ncbi:MAG TPA: dTDP-4-dehydrorhamnose 3,5-epimerase [Steroidobacteraceae bacterium]|nr:dTDP-4-dehydrorhamnose 3,5-epimerase [Steroidobacteraceae bacterium]
MRFVPTPLAGALLVEVERLEDPRGFFTRTWCAREFAAAGLPDTFVQCSVSFNRRKATLRGMHFQKPPSREAKLVRCTSGGVYDVIIDLRADSTTCGQHFGVDLDARSLRALYVPPGFAHGFQTLTDDTEVLYQMTDYYAPELGGGVRWSDPAFGIRWPLADPVIVARDNEYPDFDPARMAMRWS